MTKKTILLIGFILLKFILQYTLVSPAYDLHRDEYMHLDLGEHLAWGYMSVPPFTSWTSWLIFHFGNHIFWVRFFPALFGALTLLTVWKTIELLKGGIFALVMGATAMVFSVLMRLNLFYMPNSFDVLSWTVLYFTLISYFKTEKSKWLYIAAIVFAFGFLNKYNITFLAAGLAPALLLSNRKIFTDKHLYLAAIVALVIISPNLYWQYANNFPVIRHMDELARTQLVNVKTSDFIKEQVLFFLGSIFVTIAAFVGFWRYNPFAKYRFVLWSFVFTMILFVSFSAKGYYTIGLYPILLAFGAVYLEKGLDFGWRKYLRPVAIAIPILLFAATLKLLMPIDGPQAVQRNAESYKSFGLLRWEDGKEHELPQDFADMLAWREMARKVDSAYAMVPDKEHTLILCDNYGEAGAVNFYSKFPEMHAVSFNADYINWFPLDKKIINVIVVKDETDDDPKRAREIPIFESVRLIDSIRNPLAREYGTKVFLYLEAKSDINKRITDEIERKKNFEE